MQILSKKRFKFGDATTNFVTAGNMVIEDAPDWCAKDPLFALALADGNIMVINSKASKVKAEAEQAKAEE